MLEKEILVKEYRLAVEEPDQDANLIFRALLDALIADYHNLIFIKGDFTPQLISLTIRADGAAGVEMLEKFEEVDLAGLKQLQPGEENAVKDEVEPNEPPGTILPNQPSR